MPAAKKKADFTVRTKEFKKNPLLKRKQFVCEISHANWNGTVPSKQVRKKLAQMYKVPDDNCVFVCNMKTKFGGGSTTCFGQIYDDIESAKRIETAYKLKRQGFGKKKRPARKSIKERKNRGKAVRGKAKAKKASAKKKK